jgi:adenosylcobinamide kinase/adenosylcobinamide-phosphate guanylyltransferase
MSVSLISGGVKSGKSALAERLAISTMLNVTYIATATPDDAAMQQRISHHRQQRPSHWLTVEQPVQLAKALTEHCQINRCVLVDCLTLWLTNLLMQDNKVS